MIVLYLILIPAVFALLIFFCRKSLLIRILLLLAGFCHLAGMVYLLACPTSMPECLKNWLATDVYSGLIAAICSGFDGLHASILAFPSMIFCA